MSRAQRGSPTAQPLATPMLAPAVARREVSGVPPGDCKVLACSGGGSAADAQHFAADDGRSMGASGTRRFRWLQTRFATIASDFC
jgi:hypothetical protein